MTFVLRYFTHHPVEYMETVLFSVGLAALVVKIFDVAAQRSGLRSSPLGPRPASRQSSDQSEDLLATLGELPGRRQGEYYIARLRAALQHVQRHDSADKLDDELKYLADLDAARLHTGYGLFRVIVWAIPILGFLGTVIGITMALNSVDLQAPDKSMLQVLNGLGLKFDTTALALAFAMVLMFIHFSVENAEIALLEQVDGRVLDDLSDRFAVAAAGPASGDGQLVAVRRMAEAMMQATDSLVHRQAELWQSSVDTAARQWAKMSESAAGQVQTAMSAAAAQLANQTEVLTRAVEAAGEVTALEDALNRNLAALAGAKHFEQTVLSLAAAVNMLSARLAESPNAPVRLESTRRSVHAA
jgi:biopolymer transport protein ExbB/TolQ